MNGLEVSTGVCNGAASVDDEEDVLAAADVGAEVAAVGDLRPIKVAK